MGVWDAGDVQLARDDNFVVEDAIAGDGSAAAGGDGASWLAFDALVGVGFIDARIIWCIPVVGALGGGTRAGFQTTVHIRAVTIFTSKVSITVLKEYIN